MGLYLNKKVYIKSMTKKFGIFIIQIKRSQKGYKNVWHNCAGKVCHTFL